MNRASKIVAMFLLAWAAPLCAQDGTPGKGEAPASASPTGKGDGLVHGLIRDLVNTAVKAAVKKATDASAPATMAAPTVPGTPPTPAATVAQALALPHAAPSAAAAPTVSVAAPEPAISRPRPRVRRVVTGLSPKIVPKDEVSASLPPAPVPAASASVAVPSIPAPAEVKASRRSSAVIERRNDAPDQRWWLSLVAGLIAAGISAPSLIRARRIARTRSLLSIHHRFDREAGAASIGKLKFAAPPVLIRARLDLETANG